MRREGHNIPIGLASSATAALVSGALSVAIAAAIVHYAASERIMIFGAVVLITYLQLFTWRARLGRVPLAAVVLVALNSVAVFGELFYRRIADVAAVSATLSTDATAYRSGVITFAVASLALWIGGLAGTAGVKRRASVPRADLIQLIAAVSRWRVIPTMIASSIPLALGVASLSFHGMVSRPSYSQTYGPTVLVKPATILLPIGLAGASLLFFNRLGKKSSRVWAFLLLVLYATYLFSKASRAITLMPMVLYGTYLLLPTREGYRRRIRPLLGLVVAGVTLFLLHLPLTLRGGSAGLFPYWTRISESPSILWPTNPFEAVGNLLFSLPLTGHIVTSEQDLPLSYFLTAVNPLPGSFTNWSAIQGGLRVNAATPFNALGELMLYGMPFLVGYFVVAGFLTMRLEVWADSLSGMRSLVARLVVGGLLLLFSMNLLQYNLRSSTRLLWYAVLIVTVLRLIPRVPSSPAAFGAAHRSANCDHRTAGGTESAYPYLTRS